jgi:hypothetical protein
VFSFFSAKTARIQKLVEDQAEEQRRKTKITSQHCPEAFSSSPDHKSFTEAFRKSFDECEENLTRWRSYLQMVSCLEKKYGKRPIKGWTEENKVWTAPLDETWTPLVTPDIQDMRDVDEFAYRAKDRANVYDAVDAWERWFYPLKHFYDKEFGRIQTTFVVTNVEAPSFPESESGPASKAERPEKPSTPTSSASASAPAPASIGDVVPSPRPSS